jgi:hypothetical protein
MRIEYKTPRIMERKFKNHGVSQRVTDELHKCKRDRQENKKNPGAGHRTN